MDSIYSALGGEAGIDRLVTSMYRRILADPELRPFFDGLDMPGQHAKFRAFLQTVTGAPAQRSGIELRAAHSKSVENGLTAQHFDAFVRHFEAALRDTSAEDDVIRTVIDRIEAARADVLEL